ncbi:hypothetical protein DE146DRAFT_756691 [Phaeosphaeria sp. MPI-PUGE-AT-0046c]|nr:hypothetical protein DE146DRAFT_756691 [Phaeosphaeria sp. MPI-PUGE-AT-0046c]
MACPWYPESLATSARNKGYSDEGHRDFSYDARAGPGIDLERRTLNSFRDSSNTSHLSRTLPPPWDPYSDAPREALPDPILLPSQTAQYQIYDKQPVWKEPEVLHDIMFRGQLVRPVIQATIERGFFFNPSQQIWTTYRLSDFYLAAHISFDDTLAQACVKAEDRSTAPARTIHAVDLVIKLSACNDQGQSVSLHQHVPKRRKSDRVQPKMFSVTPSKGYCGTGCNRSETVEWKRVQFFRVAGSTGRKRSTLRRAYMHLVVEVFAKMEDGDKEKNWICVARRTSLPLNIIGGSPRPRCAEPAEPEMPVRTCSGDFAIEI